MEYRSSAWSLRDALAPDDALSLLAARPMQAENAEAVRLVRARGKRNAKRKSGDALVARGFHHVGMLYERAGYVGTRHDVFIDRDATTYVTMRRSRSLLGASRYFATTHFDDGTCIETHGRSQPTYGSSAYLRVRAGHDDDVVRDVSEHLEAVRDHAATGARVLPVRDIDDVVALTRYNLSHVVQPALASGVSMVRESERGLALQALGALGIAAMIVVSIIQRL